MARLDDEQLRSDLLIAVGRLGTVELAAKEIGLSRRSIGAYLARPANEEFKLAVDAARRRSSVITTHAAAPPSSLAAGCPGGLGVGALTPAGRAAFITLLELHAADGGSKGCSKALDILAQLHFAPELLAMKAEAKQLEQVATEQVRPVVIRDPGPAPRVIDAELVPDIA